MGVVLNRIVFYNSLLDNENLYKLYILACASNVAYRHACLIFDRRGNIVASGYNYSPNYSNPFHTIHAEHSAINDLKSKGLYGKAHNYTLLVIRVAGCVLVDRDGKSMNHKNKDTFMPTHMCVKFGNSKPCTDCQHKIDEAGFMKVIHSTANK